MQEQKKPIRMLITGQNSYLGRSVDSYLQDYNAAQGQEHYHVERISLRGADWRNISFAGYDTLLHMAGIAHADVGKASEEEQKRYYAVNCDLAVEVAQKAKQDGAKQFIYMSSVIIYGDSAPVGETRHITAQTEPRPANFYGNSKLQAEKELMKLVDDKFHVAIIRTPMVYGRGSKGNFPLLKKMAEKLPIFPTVSNERSMIYVEHLAEFLRLLVESGVGGTFFPQNETYVSTWHMVSAIGEASGKQVRPCKLLNPFVALASRCPGKIGKLANKAFGSLTIDQALSRQMFDGYCRYSLEESIRKIYEMGD
ncbi:MAG: NAD-dependent epimerase/dehydratase family protein [Lachnospiraceae bacterium]|nr:NAD-dependent epimerase/dehydratase family protein [Lachnospiraceae bacterium]